jgi:hypothetical protein
MKMSAEEKESDDPNDKESNQGWFPPPSLSKPD